MARFRAFVSLLIGVFLIALCENVNSHDVKLTKNDDGAMKFVSPILDYYNKDLPQEEPDYKDGVLISAHKKEFPPYNTFVVVDIAVPCIEVPCDTQKVRCHAELESITGEKDLRVVEGSIYCKPVQDQAIPELPEVYPQEEVVEEVVQKSSDSEPVQLTHEVQLNDQYVGSGEQFVAVRRETGTGNWCPNCPTKVNTDAQGVAQLAEEAVAALNSQQHLEKYNLNSVVSVERQALIVNGVKYFLVLETSAVSCSQRDEFGRCAEELTALKYCSVVILEKPWIKLPNGNKFRAILSNNCTDTDGKYNIPVSDVDDKSSNLENMLDMKFGSNLPEPVPNQEDPQRPLPNYDTIANSGTADDILKVVHDQQLQAANQKKIDDEEITAERLKAIEDQIITDMESNPDNKIATSQNVQEVLEKKVHVEDEGQVPMTTPAVVYVQESVALPKIKNENDDVQISEDKKSALDGMMDLFGFDQFEPQVTAYRQPVEESIAPMSAETAQRVIIFDLEQQEPSILDRKSVKEEILEPVTQQKMVFPESQLEEKVPVQTELTSEEFLKTKESSEENSSEEGKGQIVIRNKRSTIGAPVTDETATVKRLADLAVETLDSYDIDNNKRIVLQIMKSKKETNSHFTKYHLQLKVGFSKCLESAEEKEDCELLQQSDNTKVCYVEIEIRPNGEEKVTKSHCLKKDKSNRTKRGLPGGVSPVNLEDDNIAKLAGAALSHYEVSSQATNKHRLVKILSASKQVVQGTLFKIEFEAMESDCPISSGDVSVDSCKISEGRNTKTCKSSVWERPWLTDEARIIKIECETNNINIQTKKVKRALGGPSEVDIEDPKIKELALLTMSHYELTSSSPNRHKVVKIVSATRQVVSGSLTKIKFEAKESDCPTSKPETHIDSCNLIDDTVGKICMATVWDRPWLENGRDVKIKCEPNNNTVRSKRDTLGALGAPVVLNVVDPEISQLASLSLNDYELTSTNINRHKIIRIISATRKVVTGYLTKITFEVKESDCLKSSEIVHLDNCNLLEDAEVKTCLATIWDRPWLTDERKINIQCERASGPEMVDIESLKDHMLDRKSFHKFIIKHGRTYGDNRQEYAKRFEIFRNNLLVIDTLNKYEQGTAKYGVNLFADISSDEFRYKYLGLRPDLKNENDVPMMKAEIPLMDDMPTEFDWRDQGAVTPVKNQGSCGSCWAFSVTGNIEGQWKIKNGKLLSLSEQELVDCDKLDEGCNGGLPDQAYRAIEQLGGLELESDYPYDAEDETCHFNKSLSRVQISGAVNISSNETDMQKWLLQNGPISIGLNANAMQFYMGGVSHPFKFLCNPENLDHGVLIVGYGVHTYPLFKKRMPFWTIKNSWGPSWGEQGYYRLYRGEGVCGVNQMASSAVI